MVPDSANKVVEREFDLNKYHVDEDIGFMLQNPLETLPPYFDDWNRLAGNLQQMVKERRVRTEVEKLPVLDDNLLEGHRQLRLAHLQLSLVVSGFVWQDGDLGVAKVLPACLAVPFTNISTKLGIKPVLGHASLALANWGLKDSTKPVSLENLRCLYNLPGESEAEWFVTVTANVEFTFAKCLKSVVGILQELNKGFGEGGDVASIKDEKIIDHLTQHLNHVACVIKDMENNLACMHENLAAKTFFNVLRPFLGGWGGEGNSLPDGLIYEGVSDSPVKLPGGSAAQSSTLQVLDAILGVEHTQEKHQFLVHMRDFMPTDHRRLVDDLENWPHKLRDFVVSSTSSRLKICYNNCLKALVEFRSYHISIVTKYIVIASKEGNEGNYESLDDKGTGGTSLIPFLKTLRKDTDEKAVNVDRKETPTAVSSFLSPPTVLLLYVASSVLAGVGIVLTLSRKFSSS